MTHKKSGNLNVPTTKEHLKRLYFRSGHRGWKENDLILGQFAEKNLGTLPDNLIPVYESLLDEDDGTIWDWLIGKYETPEHYRPIIEMLKQYKP